MIRKRVRGPSWVYVGMIVVTMGIIAAVIFTVFGGGRERVPRPPNPNIEVPQAP